VSDKRSLSGNAPLAEDALRQIGALYKIEDQIRGQSAEQRQSARNAKARPLVDAFKTWLDATLARVPGRSKLADVIRYAIRHWQGLIHFLDDGRIEIDSNTVERSMRPIALNRKNALFAGHDRGGVLWGIIASLIETRKINTVDPQAYLADVLSRLVNGWTMRQIDDLLPWACAEPQTTSAVA
jgi:hypothetical protein